MTYDKYIHQKLYDPFDGYYMKNKEKIGKAGDFYTAPVAFPVFSEMMARFFIRLVEGESLQPVFCEIGSGNGNFASGFIGAIKRKGQTFLEKFRYISIEKSPYHRNLQFPFTKDGNFTLLEDIGKLNPMEGVIFLNECFDALPVHVIVRKGGALFEVWVAEENGRLSERLLPLGNEGIKNYLKRFPKLTIEEGQRVEIPLPMETMYRQLAERLNRGYLVIIDYGYTFAELKRPNLRNGSLRIYKNHRMGEISRNVEEDVDITHHIHFEALMEWGRELGLTTVDFLPLKDFLVREGILDELVQHKDRSPFSPSWKKNSAIRSLISGEGLGNYFHVIVQKT